MALVIDEGRRVIDVAGALGDVERVGLLPGDHGGVSSRAVELAEAELVAVMREIHAESDATSGEPHVTTELARRGRVVNHEHVRRLMRHHGIVGVHKPAKVRT